ncbi:hypothetical protein LC087_05300 [Bacillus carboniphilus]|uniref:Uncharacterized protein n=1 Tax=Bacillus carboniphilus TaxID=86663 RepID=A0ABY9JYH9_9BACI|nr:hypothetical protein [Bacillus carboniphilus]WLR43573.1 hypothetical protein LC087_05300 [Bacillus carboniphilus]
MISFSKQDEVIVEQALRLASINSTDYHEIEQYQRVLKKFAQQTDSLIAEEDGFRFDYDD